MNSNRVVATGNLTMISDVTVIEFIQKYAKIDGNVEDHANDNMSVAGGDEVNDSDLNFINNAD